MNHQPFLVAITKCGAWATTFTRKFFPCGPKLGAWQVGHLEAAALRKRCGQVKTGGHSHGLHWKPQMCECRTIVGVWRPFVHIKAQVCGFSKENSHLYSRKCTIGHSCTLQVRNTLHTCVSSVTNHQSTRVSKIVCPVGWVDPDLQLWRLFQHYRTRRRSDFVNTSRFDSLQTFKYRFT